MYEIEINLIANEKLQFKIYGFHSIVSQEA